MASSVLSAQTPIKTCEIHQTDEIDMFCQTCQLPYCVECIQENHHGHSWCKLSKIVQEKLRDAPRKYHDLRNVVIPKITEYIQDIRSSKDQIAQEKSEKIRRIKSQKTRICAVLENSMDKMIESIDNEHDESIKIVDEVEDTLKKDRDEIESFAANLEEHRLYTSDFSMWEMHKDLDLKINQIIKPDIENWLTNIHYIEGQVNSNILEVSLGTIQNGLYNDPGLSVMLTYGNHLPTITDASTFEIENESIHTIVPVSCTTAWLHNVESTSVELYSMEGNIMKQLNVEMLKDFTFLSNGDMVYTDASSLSLERITQTDQTSRVADTSPLQPLGICNTISGDLLVTLVDTHSFETDQNSQRLVRWITLPNGQEKKTYQYDNDDNTQQLFTVPVTVTQNYNTDVCVVDGTSASSGQVYILYENGVVKCKYLGQNLEHDFLPTDIICDLNCNILISDAGNDMIHLLHNSGQFIKYLSSGSKGLQCPFSLGLYKQWLWVGHFHGRVTVYEYKF